MELNLSDVVWQALIAAVLTVYMEWSRRRAEAGVKQVEKTVTNENERQTDKIDTMVAEVTKATNGVTDRIVTAELTAERVVAKAEAKADSLIAVAAKTASELADKVADKVADRPLLEPYTRQKP